MQDLTRLKYLTLFLLILLSSGAVSLSSCVTNCIARYPENSACTGHETGQALADCTCATFNGHNDPLLVCIRACPSSDVADFATNIPTECRSTLVPGVTATATATSSTASAAAAAVATGDADINENPIGLSVIVVVTAVINVYAL
ncbi:hypothetical protein PISL3812_00367 [Talaromyces islandicus]|uniref:Extracellular membrane protein CFEM domain-containing protein n=1 Tax=Talaromyces islandicus TaxID=28573 RepID=A0A0U1LJ35_TALIS|nr:hypothetical protein PISL3812_00367 [Talaromyces islandicus]